MSKPLAVVCAPPPGNNPGMRSVDEALVDLLTRLGRISDTSFWRVSQQGDRGPIHYQTIEDAQVFRRDHDSILFWGDFHHMAQYQRTMANRLFQRGRFSSVETAGQFVRQVLLLEDAPDDCAPRVITYGSTLLFNSIQDEVDQPYGESLRRFLRRCEGVWFRDVFSALKASHCSGDYTRSFLGTDGAVLGVLSSHVLGRMEAASRGRCGIFIGRSESSLESRVKFSQRLCDALDLDREWMPWGDAEAFPSLPKVYSQTCVQAIPGFRLDPLDQEIPVKGTFDRYSLVITDTYHVAVNSWTSGVPCVCFHGEETSQVRSVNSGSRYSQRDKRQTFFSMYDCLDFLVADSELHHDPEWQARLDHIVHVYRLPGFADQVVGRLRAHAIQAEASLIASLRDL